jgi:hypothetical protein
VDILRGRFFALERIVGTSIFHLRRNSTPMAQADDLLFDAPAFERVFASIDRSRMSLLVDFREAPIRNNPAFEAVATPLQRRLATEFRRAAVLVRTPFGKLQVSRMANENGVALAVFDDEQKALEYLKAK